MSQAIVAAASAAVKDVRSFLRLSELRTEAVKEVLEGGEAGPAVTKWATDVARFRSGRLYDYACAVVLLYGALERFVEDSADAYLTELTRGTPSYDQLPEKLRSTHFTKTTAHLQRTRDLRYDGRATADQLAAALAGCLQGKVPYELVVESMLHHTANFRPAFIDDYFNGLGVESLNRRAVDTNAFKRYLSTAAKTISVDRPESVLDLVTELVSRRNEVAHGSISDSLAASQLLPYCDQIEAYCKGIGEVLAEALLNRLVQFYGVDHGTPIEVFNHHIVCIPSRGEAICVGDSIAIQHLDGTWHAANVVEVQIDGISIEGTPAGVFRDVALRLDRRCKKTYLIRTGVYERRPLTLAATPRDQSDVDDVRAKKLAVRVEEWKLRRDEASLWLQRSSGNGQLAWLSNDYERCCIGLTTAEEALATALSLRSNTAL